MALAVLLALLLVCAEAREPSRRLHSYYPKSGGSPDTGSSPSGSSPDTSSPYSKSGGSSPDTSSPSGSSPSGSSPDTSSPYSGGSSPDTSSPSRSSPDTGSPSGSSPDTSSPYPKSGNSPDVSTPSPDTTTPSPDVDTPTPDISMPTPDTSTPSPDVTTPTPDISTPTPDTSTPTGRYGGYGSHTGCGTPKFWKGNPGRIPKLLSLVSTLGKLFGPRILGLLGHKTMMGAIKDESPEAFPSLAREGATSLINAYAYKDFPLAAMDVVKEFNGALNSAELAREQALKFQRLNEAL
ncbi:hypothetical protein GOP47_0019867 [Adiantum capillus-veneris]|uniref:Uncharacterized protein n=1 Tax=Adiantum capillus-veneris TaxID=13818 RepID=A0A9D4UCK9_ADICA|nr:hypothetical protein GOP47_0019867 [Adiantum capillus-veneris]